MLTTARVGLYLVMVVGFLFALGMTFLVPGVYDGSRFVLISIGAVVVVVALFLHDRLTDFEVRKKKSAKLANS